MSLFSHPNIVPNPFDLFQLGNTKVDILKNVCAALFRTTKAVTRGCQVVKKTHTHKKKHHRNSQYEVCGNRTKNNNLFFSLVTYI